MKLNKILAILALCFTLAGCYEKFESVPEREIFEDASFEAQFPEARHITIAECKELFTDAHKSISGTGSNASWGDTKYELVEEDLDIKGKVVSDDEQGNVYKSLYIQDETTGIEVKLNNNVGVRYPYGTWVYVRLKGLYIGNYRMMLNIGGAPSESYNKAGEHKFYANSNLEIQSIIDEHVFPGGKAELNVGTFEQWKANPASVDIITVTKQNYKEVFSSANREMMFGRLVRFEGLKCHYAGVKDQNGVKSPALKSGSNENIYPSWVYTDPRPIVNKAWYRWAFRETDVTDSGEEYATGRSLYGSVLFTYNDDLLALDGSDASLNKASKFYCSDDGNYIVRTSGYSRFANRPLCKDGEEATITAIYCIYSKTSDYTGGQYDYALYQLTLNRFDDMVFTNGDAAFLTEEQVEAMTDDEMRYVPWIDDLGEVGE